MPPALMLPWVRAAASAAARSVLAIAGAVGSGAGLVDAAFGATTGPAAPQVRVVQPMHDARIDQIRADPAMERLATLSADKTIRLWRLSDLTSIRTIVLPARPGPEGVAYALAWSTDGRRLYAAGWTGLAWTRASTVYEFDPDSGRLVGTLGSFPDVPVTALDAAPDGRHLAVGLADGGVAWIDLQARAEVARDAEYRGPVRFLHHAQDGRLAAASLDGCVRLYGPDRARLAWAPYPVAGRPADECQPLGLGGVRFSPDGRWLAVGTTDRRDAGRWRPEVAILDGRTLAARRFIRVSTPGQLNLCCVAWSRDGRALFVNGTVDGPGPTPLYRIRDALSGVPQRWEIGRQTFANMLPMPDGGLVFATTVPSLVRVDAQGRTMRHRDGRPVAAQPATVDFWETRRDVGAFRVRADGAAVGLRTPEGRWWTADLLQPDPSAVMRPSSPETLAGFDTARRSGMVVDIAMPAPGAAATAPPTVNGRSLDLTAGEIATAWTVHPSRPWVAVATQWRLLVVDHEGRAAPGWEEPPFTGMPAYHLAFSGSGTWLVGAFADGTVRWRDTATADERAGVLVLPQEGEWAAWRSDGAYASSARGDRHVGWFIDRGPGRDPDLLQAVQFERELYRPDLVRAVFASDPIDARRSPALAAPTALSAPRVRIESVDAERREVRFTVEPTTPGQPVRSVGVYANGLPVLDGAARRQLAADSAMTRTVRIPQPLPLDRIRVEAEADRAIGLDEAGVVQPQAAAPGRRGRLWVVAIGVGRFDGLAACGVTRSCRVRLRPLPNAVNDAAALAERLQTAGSGVFTEVRARVLTTGRGGHEPTRAAVLAALVELQQARPEDTVAVFLGSHGLAGGPGSSEYYFVPADADIDSIEAVTDPASMRGPGPAPAVDGLVSATELVQALRPVAGRRVLIIDTCHAGGAAGLTNPFSLAKRSAAAQIAVLAASRGDELSYEHADPAVAHGAFTAALLRALEGGRTSSPGAALTLADLHRLVVPDVADNLRRLLGREDPAGRGRITQTPVLVASDELGATPLAARAPRVRN